MKRVIIATAVIAVASVGCDGEPSEPTTGETAAIATPAPAERGSDRFLTALAGCMNDAGFQADPDLGNGRIIYEVPVEQREQRDAAEKTCLDELAEAGTIAESGSGGPEGDEIVALYDQWTAGSVCLREAGYDIEPMPSLELFREDPGSHNPLFDVVPLREVQADPGATRDLVEQLQDECDL